MAKHRIFVAPEWIDAHLLASTLPLPQEAIHRLCTVLRLEVGSRVEVFDGRGRVIQGNLQVEPIIALVELLEQSCEQPETPLCIVQAVLKMDKLEQVVQRGVELGATRFVLFQSARSNVDFGIKGAAKLERLQRIAQDAARQSLRTTVPVVEGFLSTAEIAHVLQAAEGTKVMGVLGASTLLSTHLAADAPIATKGLYVIVGPEGGLSAEEQATLLAAGALGVRWGAHVMRAETAGFAALAIAQVYLGNA